MLRNLGRVGSAISKQPQCAKSRAQCLSTSTAKHVSDNKGGGATTLEDESLKTTAKSADEPKPKKKTQAELDQELQLKLQGLAGDGGDAGVEYEDGKPVSMKRSVKNNMFRYI